MESKNRQFIIQEESFKKQIGYFQFRNSLCKLWFWYVYKVQCTVQYTYYILLCYTQHLSLGTFGQNRPRESKVQSIVVDQKTKKEHSALNLAKIANFKKSQCLP